MNEKNVHEKVVDVKNVSFETALGENKPNAWGRGYLQLYACCLLVYLCSTMNGMLLLYFAHVYQLSCTEL